MLIIPSVLVSVASENCLIYIFVLRESNLRFHKLDVSVVWPYLGIGDFIFRS